LRLRTARRERRDTGRRERGPKPVHDPIPPKMSCPEAPVHYNPGRFAATR
jgi:hypothetical protein